MQITVKYDSLYMTWLSTLKDWNLPKQNIQPIHKHFPCYPIRILICGWEVIDIWQQVNHDWQESATRYPAFKC